MKKKIVIPIIIIVILIVMAVVYYFLPKTFGKDVNPSEVDHINVFDGNTGTGFTITNPEDIKFIVENIQSHTMKKDGISLGRMGYSLKISYIDSNDKDVIPVFTLNSDNTIRKDPFFYVCDGGLCFDYIKECEEKYKTNETDATEKLREYTQNADGTWECEGNIYKYKLEITGRMNNAACNSTFVYLSNIESISFDQAWKAAGFSSNSNDYFETTEAILVDWINEE